MALSTDTSTCHRENQAITREDLDILAKNLTQTFSEQLRNIAAQQNSPQQNNNTELNANLAAMAQKI